MSHKKYREETNCLNCGAEVGGKFCPACGQENIEIRESFSHMAGHFIADYFHYDSKFLKGLLPLFTKPGYLTKEYLEGKRVSNIHPLRLFFFSTIIMVIVTSFYYKHFEDDIRKSVVHTTRSDSKPDTTGSTITRSLTLKLSESKNGEPVTETGMRNKFYEGLDGFFHNIKYVSFFLLPVYALIFKLLFVRRKTYYVDHLVYTLHLQSFVYVIVSLFLLLPLLISPKLQAPGIITAIILIYITLSVRYIHQQAWWKTILKSILATAACVLLTSIVFVGYVAVVGLT